VWNAYVKHDLLGSNPTYVNGGSFEMATRSPSALDFVSGTLAYHGGTIPTLDRGAHCTNQQYLVSDRLQSVETSTTSGGSGRFAVTADALSLFGVRTLRDLQGAGGRDGQLHLSGVSRR
jgi:hypothetical protein